MGLYYCYTNVILIFDNFLFVLYYIELFKLSLEVKSSLIKEAHRLLHGFQFSYIEGTNNNKGGNVPSTFYVESDFGVGFIIKSREIGFFQCKVCP